MLNYAYDEKSVPWPDSSLAGTTFDIHHILDLYRVGDKYDFPSFRLQLIFRLMTALDRWFSRPSKPPNGYAAESEEFCEIIRKVYDIVGSEHQEDNELVETLLQAIDEHSSARILNNTGGKQGMIVKASREVAEFGRDIFLHLMDIVGTEDHKDGTVSITELCTGTKVVCLLCEQRWWKVVVEGSSAEDEKDEGLVMRCICEDCDGSMQDVRVLRRSDP